MMPNIVRDTRRSRELSRSLRDYQACPCGSGKKFKFCCRARFKDLERRCVDKRVPGTNSYI